MYKSNFLIFFFVGFLSTSLLAQEKSKATSKRPPIDPNRFVELNYGNPAWNQDPIKVDTAMVIIRDASTKKIVLLSLQETGPDENLFRGVFSVSWGTASSLVPEVYVPNQENIKTQAGKEKVLKQINEGQLKRKPFILTKGSKGQQVIEVFDKREQAKTALNALKQKLAIERGGQVPESFAEKTNLELTRKAQLEAELIKRKLEAVQAETDRIRLLQIEQKKVEERKDREKTLALAEKMKRKKRAKVLADEAIAHYAKGEFDEAKNKFEQSTELDPNNTNYYYAYAITLYRLEQFNKAIVVFQSVDNPEIDQNELSYYLAMSYFRIKDFPSAHSKFKPVIDAKVEPLSSSASFYDGLCFFAEKKWELAKNSFQWVLDNSKDPSLDEQAESYIEQIARQQYFENNQEKKHILTASMGLQYDSNVLLQADNSSNATGSGKADYRYSIQAGYQWRPIYLETKEFSVKTSIYYLASSDAANETADPLLVQVSAPYVIKGKIWNKGFKSEIIPKIEQLYMFPDADSDRQNILDTYGVDWKNTLINSERHFSSYNFSLTQNNSHSTITDEAQNSDALKFDFYYSNTWFVDKKRTTGWVLDTGISLYNATGDDQRYNRIDIAASYLRPIPWKDFISVTRLNVYQGTYPKHADNRKDTYMNLTYSLQKPLTKALNLILGASYTKNSSSESTKAYSKYGVSSMLTGKWEY